MSIITRREFMKMAALGAVSALIPSGAYADIYVGTGDSQETNDLERGTGLSDPMIDFFYQENKIGKNYVLTKKSLVYLQDKMGNNKTAVEAARALFSVFQDALTPFVKSEAFEGTNFSVYISPDDGQENDLYKILGFEKEVDLLRALATDQGREALKKSGSARAACTARMIRRLRADAELIGKTDAETIIEQAWQGVAADKEMTKFVKTQTLDDAQMYKSVFSQGWATLFKTGDTKPYPSDMKLVLAWYLWGLGKDKNKRFSYSNVSLAGDALSESAKRLLNGSLALKSYVPALSDKEVARICTPPEKKEPEEGKKVGEQKKPGQPLDRRR